MRATVRQVVARLSGRHRERFLPVTFQRRFPQKVPNEEVWVVPRVREVPLPEPGGRRVWAVELVALDRRDSEK